MFKDYDIVKIKPKWRDGDFEKSTRYIVSNVNSDMRRCDISLIDAPKYGFPLGSIQLVSFDMIEKVSDYPDFTWSVKYLRKNNIRTKVIVAKTEPEARYKARVKRIVECTMIAPFITI